MTLRDFWPPDDNPEHHNTRIITLMAAFYTCGFVLWAKFLVWVVRSICSC